MIIILDCEWNIKILKPKDKGLLNVIKTFSALYHPTEDHHDHNLQTEQPKIYYMNDKLYTTDRINIFSEFNIYSGKKYYYFSKDVN